MDGVVFLSVPSGIVEVMGYPMLVLTGLTVVINKEETASALVEVLSTF